MKFLVDIGVGKSVDDYLTNSGHDVKTLRKIKANMSDEDILNLAIAENRIVITMDKDFGELVFHSAFNHKGILLLRLEDMNGDEKTEVMKYILDKYSESIPENFCVYKNGKLRIRSNAT